MNTAEKIEQLLRESLSPLHLEIRDESARHLGHPGAAGGGGHFHLLIVSAAFDGQTRIEQHRTVNRVLGDLMGGEIHALGLTTRTPSDWRRGAEGERGSE